MNEILLKTLNSSQTRTLSEHKRSSIQSKYVHHHQDNQKELFRVYRDRSESILLNHPERRFQTKEGKKSVTLKFESHYGSSTLSFDNNLNGVQTCFN